MMLFRKIAAVAAGMVFAIGAWAADAGFPTAPVKLIVPYGAGGTGDVVARIVGEKVAAELGQPIIIDNRSGGSGAIGAQVAARSKPDGYSLLFMATAHVILPSLKQVPYDWPKEFTPVYGITATPLVFAVNGRSKIQTLGDLLAAAKAAPRGLNYASGGPGSISHLAAARLLHELKVSGTHIPFRGFSPAVQALLSNEVDFICATVADVVAFTKSGDIRILAVSAERRHPLLAEVPTMKELGYADFDAASWNAVMAPADTPSDAINRLSQAFASALADHGVQDRLAKLGVISKPMTRPELVSFLKNESTRWQRVAKPIFDTKLNKPLLNQSLATLLQT
jgi:tripartite-type tricarboxylate transporter receptor subunit TctC